MIEIIAIVTAVCFFPLMVGINAMWCGRRLRIVILNLSIICFFAAAPFFVPVRLMIVICAVVMTYALCRNWKKTKSEYSLLNDYIYHHNTLKIGKIKSGQIIVFWRFKGFLKMHKLRPDLFLRDRGYTVTPKKEIEIGINGREYLYFFGPYYRARLYTLCCSFLAYLMTGAVVFEDFSHKNPEIELLFVIVFAGFFLLLIKSIFYEADGYYGVTDPFYAQLSELNKHIDGYLDKLDKEWFYPYSSRSLDNNDEVLNECLKKCQKLDIPEYLDKEDICLLLGVNGSYLQRRMLAAKIILSRNKFWAKSRQ